MSFLSRMTMGGRIFFAIIIVCGIYGAHWAYVTYMPKPVKESQNIDVADLPPLSYDRNSNAPLQEFPDVNQVSQAGGTEVRAGVMGWNAQSGLLAAVGGLTTMKGSIMDQQGVRVRLICQNDCNEQGNQLYAFIADYAGGNKNSAKGYNTIAWMGDGVPSYLPDLNKRIEKEFGKEYCIKAYACFGASFGEDKFIFADPQVRANPQLLRGALVIGVLMDGDWNIAMKFCDLNDIPVNNDPATFDPDAVNWMGVADYLKAAEMYVNKVSETRPIVRKGKRVGRDTTVVINGCVTWTPGDANAFKNRGGITVASTKDYSAQMPNVWLASNKWLQDNRTTIEKFILGGCLGGDQVKSHSSWLTFASKVSDQVYQDKTMSPQLWEAYFKGETYTDKTGVMNELGGSRVFNLADDAEYFGLNGSTDKYQAVYTTFGDIDVKAYKEKIPSYLPYGDVMDISYMQAVYQNNKSNSNMTAASLPNFTKGQSMTQFVSKKSVTVEFDFGKASIKSSSYPVLEQLTKDMIIAENLLVSVEGHTDNVGNANSNLTLSEARAESIRTYLTGKDPAFVNKIQTKGYGDTKPVAENTTEKGRQKNRRVEIIFGK